MKITGRGLNRAVLGRQLLLGREALGVADAVRRVVALQAQEPASPYIALWNRVDGFDPAGLDAAFAGGRVVRTTLMRVTLHAVHGDDYRAFREAMEPTLRASRLGDRRFAVSGLSVEDVQALLPDLLEYAARPRTGEEIRDRLGERLGAPVDGTAWRLLRQYAPLLHAPAGGPWSFGARQSFAAAGARPVLDEPDAADAALRVLVRRYLEGFGPGTVADVARFATVPQTRVRKALRAMGDGVERLEGPGGAVLYDLPGAPRPPEDTPAPPRLMAMWDGVLLSHADRDHVIPPEYRPLVIRRNGDVLPVLLVDGRVAGVWRAAGEGIEATAFRPLPEDAWEGLAAEARSLLRFLAGREPQVYRRYHHWWARLPGGAATRVLPG
ncbi:winged helix DNA-binding domain-containing protein [Actinomadura sp. 21ATH]|uniref:winged helix DNA-binding domain-containing protein n=1 Tax=Actinomadura sp. 21ATH TaxID=1735444 RepID=UPI0035BF15FF